MTDKSFSSYAARNSEPILEVLRTEFAASKDVLEIGSGSGQHAVYFATALPHLQWQPSDRRENVQGIQRWIDDSDLENIGDPWVLDVLSDSVLEGGFDAVFSANTAHIMSWTAVEKMFALVDGMLREDGCFCLYGPFRHHGDFNAPSNAKFDQYLRDSDPCMGIRELQQLDQLALSNRMERSRLYAMPTNNHLAVWRRKAS